MTNKLTRQEFLAQKLGRKEIIPQTKDDSLLQLCITSKGIKDLTAIQMFLKNRDNKTIPKFNKMLVNYKDFCEIAIQSWREMLDFEETKYGEAPSLPGTYPAEVNQIPF